MTLFNSDEDTDYGYGSGSLDFGQNNFDAGTGSGFDSGFNTGLGSNQSGFRIGHGYGSGGFANASGTGSLDFGLKTYGQADNSRTDPVWSDPYNRPQTKGPFSGWSTNAMEKFKESVSPRDYGYFLQDRIGTYVANRINMHLPPLEPSTSYHPVDYGQGKGLYEQAVGTRGIGRTDEDLGITPGAQAATNTLETPAPVAPVMPIAAGSARSRGDVIAATMRRTDPARLLEPDHPFAKALAEMTPSMKRNYTLALIHNTSGIGGVPRDQNPFRDAYYAEKFAPEITGEAEMLRLLDRFNKGDTEGLDAGEKMFGWGSKAAAGLDLMNLSSRAQGDGVGDGGGPDGGDGFDRKPMPVDNAPGYGDLTWDKSAASSNVDPQIRELYAQLLREAAQGNTGFDLPISWDPEALYADAGGKAVSDAGGRPSSQAAPTGAVDIADFVNRVIGAETGGDPNKRNPNSSAAGPGHVTKGKRDDIFKESKLDAWSPDWDEQIKALRYLANKNARILRNSLGREPSFTDLYAAWFLGEGDGPKFLSALAKNPDAPAKDVISKSSVDANDGIFYVKKDKNDTQKRPRTCREVYEILDRKMNP